MNGMERPLSHCMRKGVRVEVKSLEESAREVSDRGGHAKRTRRLSLSLFMFYCIIPIECLIST